MFSSSAEDARRGRCACRDSVGSVQSVQKIRRLGTRGVADRRHHAGAVCPKQTEQRLGPREIAPRGARRENCFSPRDVTAATLGRSNDENAWQ
jgi:hypothetical protein